MIETADGVFLIEAKSGDRWERKFAGGLARLRVEPSGLKTVALGVYCGERPLVEDDLRVLPWDRFLAELWSGALIK